MPHEKKTSRLVNVEICHVINLNQQVPTIIPWVGILEEIYGQGN